MPFDPTTPPAMLPTPDGYATPEQVKAMQDYAAALSTKAPFQQPVRHWSQGVSNVVSALMGGWLSNRANDQQYGSLKYGANQRQNAPGTQIAPPATVAPVPNPTAPQGGSGGLPNSYLDPDLMDKTKNFTAGDAEGGSPDVSPKMADAVNMATSPKDGGASASRDDSTPKGDPGYRGAIAKIESAGSGDYAALGPPTRTGDRAYGKYQVMGANIGPWSKEILGREVTPQEFLKNPQLQDQIFDAKFDQYLKKTGNPQDAASMWFTGKPLAQGANRSDSLGTTGSEYVRRFTNALAGGAGPRADAGTTGSAPVSDSTPAGDGNIRMAFNGSPPGGPASDAVSAITMALAKGGAAPSPTVPYPNTQVAQAQSPLIPPNLVPQRPSLTEGQYRAGQADPWLSPDQKARDEALYLQQNNPMTVPYSGGNIIIDPRNPSSQQFVPDMQKSEKDIAGIKQPTNRVYDPYSKTMIELPVTRGTAGPAAPSPAPQPSVPAAPQKRGALQFAPDDTVPPNMAENATAAPQARQQLASLTMPQNDTPDVPSSPVKAAQAAPAGPLSVEPPVAGGIPPVGVKLADNSKAPPSVSQEDWDTLRQKNALDVEKKGQEEAATETSKAYSKRYEDMTQAAQKAREELPQLQMAESMLNDPRFYSGVGADAVLTWQRVKDALGDKGAAAPNETFRKLIAGSILSGMKSMLGGLGQVRVAEINLLQQANASPYNTVAANRALVEIAKRGQERLSDFHDMATDYLSGAAVMDPANPKKVLLPANVDANGEQASRGRLDVKWDKLLGNYIKENPAFTPEQAKNYEQLFQRDKDVKPAAAGAAGKGEIVTVQSPAEAAKLPPGTRYKGPDGNERVRGAN